MAELETVVMVVCLRSKADLLERRLDLIGFLLLSLLLLLVKKLLVVQNLTDRRICIGRNLHEIKLLLLRHTASLLDGVDPLLHVVPYDTHLTSMDLLIDTIGVFIVATSATIWLSFCGH